MSRISLSRITLGIFLICSGGLLLASEADELRDRAKALRQKAAVIADREQAVRLEREAGELMETAERIELSAKEYGENKNRPGLDKEAQLLKERLQDLLAKEQKIREVMKDPEPMVAKVREQIAATERELQTLHSHHGEHRPEFLAQAEKVAVASRRIQHLRVAAENLKLADEHDLAHKLMQQAEVLERNVQEAKHHLAAEMHERHGEQGELGDIVRELRAEIERLRAEVKELGQKIDKR